MNNPSYLRIARVFAACMAFAAFAFIVSCRKDEDVADTPDNNIPTPGTLVGNSRTVDVVGQVFDESGNPLSGATVQAGYGSQSTFTDERGFFRLLDIAGFENIALVKVSKAGYFAGSRSFVPTDGQNRVRIALLAKNDAGNFSAAAGGQVSLENVEIDFAPGSIALDGQPYSGNVNVSINSIDPTDTWNMSQQMPGSLVGANGQQFDVLRSMGMAGLELTDNSGQELQLLSGNAATVRFEVPASLLADAPSTIPLWHYNETQGYWVREGEATLNGNFYVGQVSHFSFWNCDIPAQAVMCSITLLQGAQNVANPIQGAQVVITSDVFGPRGGYTDSNGLVSGLVPSNEVLEVNVYVICGNSEVLVYTTTIGPLTAGYSATWSITNLPNVALVQGQLLNASGTPVAGYVYLESGGFVSTDDGSYELLACTGSNAVSGWYYEGNNVCTSNAQVINLTAGLNTVIINVLDCVSFGQPGAGGIDQEGDAFNSVIIGSQEWMSENLSVAIYTDGTLIPQVTNPNQWALLTTGAWCWYNNDSASYAAIYGRLYNWYAVAGIHNIESQTNAALRKKLAPEGWIIPSDTAWNILTTTLDPNAFDWEDTTNVAGGLLKSTGTIEDGTGLWRAPNQMASNVSGFSGMPGGGFYGFDGCVNMGYEGNWWSSTENNVYSAWNRSLSYVTRRAIRGYQTKDMGFSVRCLRD